MSTPVAVVSEKHGRDEETKPGRARRALWKRRHVRRGSSTATVNVRFGHLAVTSGLRPQQHAPNNHVRF